MIPDWSVPFLALADVWLLLLGVILIFVAVKEIWNRWTYDDCDK
jgi:hypothetical protein